jgi:hypothetical protein
MDFQRWFPAAQPASRPMAQATSIPPLEGSSGALLIVPACAAVAMEIRRSGKASRRMLIGQQVSNWRRFQQ